MLQKQSLQNTVSMIPLWVGHVQIDVQVLSNYAHICMYVRMYACMYTYWIGFWYGNENQKLPILLGIWKCVASTVYYCGACSWWTALTGLQLSDVQAHTHVGHSAFHTGVNCISLVSTYVLPWVVHLHTCKPVECVGCNRCVMYSSLR